jgi:hypothetical protein
MIQVVGGGMRRARDVLTAPLAWGVTVALVAASLLRPEPPALAYVEEAERGAVDATPGTADTPGGAAVAPAREDLVREFNDPLTVVPQLFVQDAYTPSNFGTEAQANRVIARLIVPRIPRFSLFPLVQLIRPSLSLVTVPTGRGSATRTELGDMQLFDLAVLPWPRKESGLMMGVGPVFIFPTATHRSAGQNAWQVGPAFGAIYKAIPGLLLGFLIQNPISFAYAASGQRSVNALFVQPILLKHLWRGLYVKSADATWGFGWHDDTPTTVPLSLGLGYVIPREGSPPLNLFVSGEWMVHRRDAPIAPQATVRFGLTVAFPQLTLWGLEGREP